MKHPYCVLVRFLNIKCFSYLLLFLPHLFHVFCYCLVHQVLLSSFSDNKDIYSLIQMESGDKKQTQPHSYRFCDVILIIC